MVRIEKIIFIYLKYNNEPVFPRQLLHLHSRLLLLLGLVCDPIQLIDKPFKKEVKRRRKKEEQEQESTERKRKKKKKKKKDTESISSWSSFFEEHVDFCSLLYSLLFDYLWQGESGKRRREKGGKEKEKGRHEKRKEKMGEKKRKKRKVPSWGEGPAIRPQNVLITPSKFLFFF